MNNLKTVSFSFCPGKISTNRKTCIGVYWRYSTTSHICLELHFFTRLTEWMMAMQSGIISSLFPASVINNRDARKQQRGRPPTSSCGQADWVPSLISKLSFAPSEKARDRRNCSSCVEIINTALVHRKMWCSQTTSCFFTAGFACCLYSLQSFILNIIYWPYIIVIVWICLNLMLCL